MDYMSYGLWCGSLSLFRVKVCPNRAWSFCYRIYRRALILGEGIYPRRTGEVMGFIVKACKHCLRLNPQDMTRCISCGCSDFEPVQLLPEWLDEFGKERVRKP